MKSDSDTLKHDINFVGIQLETNVSVTFHGKAVRKIRRIGILVDLDSNNMHS